MPGAGAHDGARHRVMGGTNRDQVLRGRCARGGREAHRAHLQDTFLVRVLDLFPLGHRLQVLTLVQAEQNGAAKGNDAGAATVVPCEGNLPKGLGTKVRTGEASGLPGSDPRGAHAHRAGPVWRWSGRLAALGIWW